jgi:uncharacterized protein (TIGR03086 family)
MMTKQHLQPLFEQALDDAGQHVVRAAGADLTLPTPCAAWDLGALLGHMIGQNVGFAAAVRDGDAPSSAYAPPALDADTVLPAWHRSSRALRDAFRAAEDDRTLRLAEFDRQVSVPVALGMQIVDCAVHAWDVATALGAEYRPAEPVVSAVLASARLIAARPGGTPGVFAPAREEVSGDPWTSALRLLGR